ncbi:MAG TPA: BCCT family transporter, partial [Ramlibacter sp.]|nr:BCCT family transporter [Ramlibacter sp.]
GIIDTFTSTLGGYLSDLVRMSLRMTPFRASSWVADWTIFYWAWWISWSPFVGLFIARVSRGRTIREFLLGTVLAPTLVGFAWFSVFGGAALHLEIFANAPLAEAAKADISTTIFTMFDALPLGLAMSVVATVVVVIFFVTSGDSATLVLGMMSTGGNPNPGWKVKMVWGVLVAAIALSLMLAGGLQAIQTATIIFALPFSLVVVLMAIAVTRGIAHDWGEEQRRDRELRRKMRELAARDVDNPRP